MSGFSKEVLQTWDHLSNNNDKGLWISCTKTMGQWARRATADRTSLCGSEHVAIGARCHGCHLLGLLYDVAMQYRSMHEQGHIAKSSDGGLHNGLAWGITFPK